MCKICGTTLRTNKQLMADQKLWHEDPYLIVLHTQLARARLAYEALRRNGGVNSKNLRKHRYTVKWLIEEISQACQTYPHWYRGRQNLRKLIDLRLELDEYYDRALNKSMVEMSLAFDNQHHYFYATLRQIEDLFNNEQ